MPVLLFLTAGPYFWPHQRTIRAKYETLSEHFSGYILSFVSRKEWRRAQIGKFQLRGCYISGASYRMLPVRLFVRAMFAIFTALYLRLRHGPFDAVIACDPFATGVLAFIVAKMTGAMLFIEVNGDYLNQANWNTPIPRFALRLKQRYIRSALPLILNRADAIKLCHSRQLAPFTGLRVSEKTHVFHDFVPLALFCQESIDPRKTRYLLFAGHPWYTKGVDILLEAFSRVSIECPDVRLKVVGYLPERTAYKHLYEANEAIEFVGPVMPDEMIALVAACTLLVLPSRSEAMGRVLLEAMAARRPVVAARVGGIPEYIVDGGSGLLFDTENAGQLAQLLLRVLKDEPLAHALAEGGYRRARLHFSEHHYLESMKAMIQTARHATGGRSATSPVETPHREGA